MSNDNKSMQDTTFNTNAETPEYLTKVNELCEKVAENPERHEAFLVQDKVNYVIPISKILEIAAEKHMHEYSRCREELRATRERRDDCEVKMRKAFERRFVNGVDKGVHTIVALRESDEDDATVREVVNE